jgi:hypothetical protein
MLIVLYLLSACLFAQDARTIVERSVAVTTLDPAVEQEYTYRVRSEQRESDRKGELRVKESTLSEVLYFGGKRFSHRLQRNDQPLPEREARKEQEKLDKAAAEASRLTPAAKAKREAEAEKHRAEDREFMQAVLKAYDFTLDGETTLNGRGTWRIGCTPRASYRGKHDGLFRKLRGTLWIDQQDYHWARVEAEALDTISWGLFLARIAPGMRVMFELNRVNDEVWLPKRVEFAGSARLGLVKKFNVNQVITFSDFRRYSADSRITEVAAQQ